MLEDGHPQTWLPGNAPERAVREDRDEDVRERPDRQQVDDGPRADRAADEPPDDEHGGLDAGAYEAERAAAAARDPGHQAVARPGAEPRADVHPGRDAVEQHAAERAAPAEE